MRPYENRLNGYAVRSSASGASLMIRPTRNAAGMTATLVRRGHKSISINGGDALTLSVRGTLDSLRMGNVFLTQRVACPCCGGKASGKLALNDNGRLRLRTLQRKERERRALGNVAHREPCGLILMEQLADSY